MNFSDSLREGKTKEEALADEVRALRAATEKIEQVYVVPEENIGQVRKVPVSEMHFSRADREYIAEEFGQYQNVTKEDLVSWQQSIGEKLASLQEQSLWQKLRTLGQKNRLMHIGEVIAETLLVIDKR